LLAINPQPIHFPKLKKKQDDQKRSSCPAEEANWRSLKIKARKTLCHFPHLLGNEGKKE
jgi:cell envelope opacity-associated protein A